MFVIASFPSLFSNGLRFLCYFTDYQGHHPAFFVRVLQYLELAFCTPTSLQSVLVGIVASSWSSMSSITAFIFHYL